MPKMNSTGALKQQNSVTVIPIPDNQWIAQFNNNLTDPGPMTPTVTKNGYVYVVTPATVGITKLTPYGALVNSFDCGVSGGATGRVIVVDKNGNSYVGGGSTTSPTTGPKLIKYNSANSIVWQKTFNTSTGTNIVAIQVTPGNDLFVLINDSNALSNTGILMKINPSTGAIINQRKLLKYSTTGTTDIYVDNLGSQLVVAGTDYQTRQQVVVGFYNYTNTDTASVMIQQYSSVDGYNVKAFTRNSGIVVNGSDVYQIIYRVISGITYSTYCKWDKTTGSISYSNRIQIGGSNLQLYGITKDDYGYIYITGAIGGASTGIDFIFKIDSSTGSVVWVKSIGSVTPVIYESISSPVWSRGFLYFTAISTPSPYTLGYTACFKIKDDGSVPDGTYGTYWYIGTPATPTLIVDSAQYSGTTTGSNLTTSNTASNTSYTTSSNSITITTYSL